MSQQMASTVSIRPCIGRILNPYRTSSSQVSPITPLAAAVLAPVATTSDHQHHHHQRCGFSTTAAQSMRRPRRDNNRLRGVSAIYRTGPRWRGNVLPGEVPGPNRDYKPAEEVQVDPDHGLWQFFYGKDKLLLTPDEDAEHGRAWIVEELRHKSWEDLHRLWWVCCKEQNRIATHRREKQDMHIKHGVEETAERLAEVRKTMKAIRHTLTERYYLWEDARTLAQSDPEVNLTGKAEAYRPGSAPYVEEEETLVQPESQETGAAAVEEGEQRSPSQEGQAETPSPTPTPTAEKNIDPSTLPPTSTPGETQQEQQQQQQTRP